jgi:L-ascorbate metabolism protein UlaG (beta-lactamase superfamily)
VRQVGRPLTITWIGHGTVLVEADGVRLVTDPLLRPRVAHVRRVAEEAHATEDVDAVLISHVHHDHLDVRSLRRVSPQRFVVPRGAARLLARRGFDNVTELDEGDEVAVDGLTIRATPAEHHTRRYPLSSAIPALGFLISGSTRLYYAGDTDLFDGMRDLAGDLDVALIPIAGWGPRVARGHMDPERAAEALRLLEPRIAIPIHWGTYRRIGMKRDSETMREPARTFERLAAERAPQVTVSILQPGESVEIPPRRGDANGSP